MRRACRPSPAWLRWALPVCAAALLAPRPAVGQCNGPGFAPPTPTAVVSPPWAVVVGDFYGPGGVLDGVLDAVVSRDSTNLTLLQGNGDGTLTPLLDVPVGTNPTDLVAADFNRDGLLDLALVVGLQAAPPLNRVQVLAGIPGGFAPPSNLDVTVLPSRLATGDFDRDGILDLVVVSESAATVQVFTGDGSLGFTAFAPAPVIAGAPSNTPTAAVSGDFNHDGMPDLAVTVETPNVTDEVQVFLGDGTGHLGDGVPPPPPSENPFATVLVGSNPRDIFLGDVDRDGTPDLLTADSASGAVSVLIGDGNGGFTPETSSPAVGLGPTRIVLADFDRDGLLDVATLDGGSPQVTVLPGITASPFFDDGSPVPVPLTGGSAPQGLAVDDLDADGRPDLVATETALNNVVVALDTAGPDCPRASFLDAPRAFPGGNGPVWLAVADLDGDGLDDLVAAAQYGGSLELLRGTGNGYVPNGSVSPVPTPRGIAAADFDVNGNADVVVAAGNEVRLFPGNGDGTLGPPSTVSLGAGAMASAVVVGDFNEDGAPDVAATAQANDEVHILLGDGFGGLSPAGPPILTQGSSPRSLATGRIDGNGTLDIVVVNSLGVGGVTVLLGNGDGTFTEPLTSPHDPGTYAWGVALADFDGDSQLDVAAADNDNSGFRVYLGTGTGDFGGPSFQSVSGKPIAMAALDVTADTKDDVMVVTGDNHTLVLRAGNGDGSFQSEVSFPLSRRRPSAIAPVDADADGRPDLAIPCRDGDSVVVLLARPPGFAQAPTVPVGNSPRGVVTADLDNNGTLDLAVVNSADDTVTVLDNDGAGVFTPRPTSPVAVGGFNPESLVVADFNRDGLLDLATSNIGPPADVSILFGVFDPGPPPVFYFTAATTYLAGTAPNDLVVADFNRDGAPDLAVCNRVSPGQITFLENDGAGAFTLQGPVVLGLPPLPPGPAQEQPTSIVAADFNGDGRTDVGVANVASGNLTVLYNDGSWSFSAIPPDVLEVTGETSPVSLATGDFDGDGDIDLVTVASGSTKLRLFENTGGAFMLLPTQYETSDTPVFVTAADLNRDGRLDAAVAVEGLKVFPGQAGLDFEPGEDVIGGRRPHELAVGDFDRDGRPDVAAANGLSNDVSILLSSACLPRRLVVSPSPVGCGAVGPLSDWVVSAQDDGGNLAKCAAGDVVASIGAGNPLASLSGDVDVAPVDGKATFNTLSIDQPGARYQLAFDLAPLPTVLSRSFTLGATVTFIGPPSICPPTFETYTADPGFESYRWFLDGSLTPFDFGPTAVVDAAVGPGSHDLTVEARIDTCAPTDTKSVYVGNLASVTITPGGPVTVCVDCLGGPVTATEVGGGTPVDRQWGYRTVSITGPITDIDGQKSDTYVINGLDFPGPGTYFLVETTEPECGSIMTSNEVAVTITEIVPSGEVRTIGVTSRGPGGLGEHVLQWVNTTGAVEENLIRWNKALTGSSLCSPPADTLASFDGEHSEPNPLPLSIKKWTNNGVELDTAYCYSVWVKVAGSYSPGRTVKARATDTSTGAVQWNYATGATAVVPPTVVESGIAVMSNDRNVQLLTRGTGPLGGEWPLGWTPPPWLSGLVNSRSPVVPFVAPRGAAVPSDIILFAGDDTGEVVAVNAESGQAPWAAPASFPSTVIIGAPGGLFAQWNGSYPADVIVVGTRTSAPAGVFHTLNVDSGAVIDSFDGGGTLGAINSTPAVDYSTERVCFTSWSRFGTEPSVWCVQIQPSGTIDPTPVWTQTLGDIDASPVLMNGRLYVANNAGEVYSLDAETGTPGPPLNTGDGPVKGFLFPDRRGDDLYFATETTVWSVRDTAGTLTSNWTFDDGGTLKPSIVLHRPQTDYLYFGSEDGKLYQLDFSAGPPANPCAFPSCIVEVLGDGTDRIGAPSLDIGVVPPDVSPGKKLLLVGSEAGRVYSVEVPWP